MRTSFLLLLVIVCVLVMAGCQAIQPQANNDTGESAAVDPSPPVEAVEEAVAPSGAPDEVDVNETTTAQRMVDEVAVSVDEAGVIKVDDRTVDPDKAIDAVKQESPLRPGQPLRPGTARRCSARSSPESGRGSSWQGCRWARSLPCGRPTASARSTPPRARAPRGT